MCINKILDQLYQNISVHVKTHKIVVSIATHTKSHYKAMRWLTLSTAFKSSPDLIKRSTTDGFPPIAAQCKTVSPFYVYNNTQQMTRSSSQSYNIPSILTVSIYLYTNLLATLYHIQSYNFRDKIILCQNVDTTKSHSWDYINLKYTVAD